MPYRFLEKCLVHILFFFFFQYNDNSKTNESHAADQTMFPNRVLKLVVTQIQFQLPRAS